MFKWLRRKTTEVDYDALVAFAVADLISTPELSTPVYLGEIRSEVDAGNRADRLPLIYIWNENRSIGSFSLSVNGSIVGRCLEAVLPRSHPRFDECRDRVMQAISEAAQRAVIATCEEVNSLPSHLFSEPQRSMLVASK